MSGTESVIKMLSFHVEMYLKSNNSENSSYLRDMFLKLKEPLNTGKLAPLLDEKSKLLQKLNKLEDTLLDLQKKVKSHGYNMNLIFLKEITFSNFNYEAGSQEVEKKYLEEIRYAVYKAYSKVKSELYQSAAPQV